MGDLQLVKRFVPLDRVLSAIRWKVCKLCYPKNPTLTSWRDRQLLKAIGENFCEAILIPNMVDAWAAAGKAPQKPVERAEASSGYGGACSTANPTSSATGGRERAFRRSRPRCDGRGYHGRGRQDATA
jgi:hypothetical protein